MSVACLPINNYMRKLFFALGCVAIATACQTGKKVSQTKTINQTIAAVKKQYAPDKRVAVFTVETSGDKKAVLLKGETSVPEAKQALLDELAARKINVIDSIKTLPTGILGDKTYAVVTLSVANIRSQPDHSAELATQALLGTPLKVLNQTSYWYQVQTPDNYISWVDKDGIQLMNASEFDAWQRGKKLIYTEIYGFSYGEPNASAQTVSDLVGGDIVRLEKETGDYYHIAFPDGRESFIPKTAAQPYEKWLASLQISEESLVHTAKKLMGIPYLWGGTSLKGVDCSGFTKTVYFLNGLVLPRDASQQVHTGDAIDTSNGYDQLQPGDLLFFGKPATDTTSERVVHVGMWIGKGEFIHSSGKVEINSFDPKAANFDEPNFKRFLRAKRILNTTSSEVVNLQQAKIY